MSLQEGTLDVVVIWSVLWIAPAIALTILMIAHGLERFLLDYFD